MKVLTILGTRPEAIKMAPLLKELTAAPGIGSRLCVTAQHREMLDQVLALFEIRPDIDLNLMQNGQDLTNITTRILQDVQAVLSAEEPDLILVHGDTTTTLSATLAAYYQRIPVGHVEAGLRSGNMYAPWPEEMNRRLVGAIATYHFAPTWSARANLLAEGVDPASITVTGNTVIDALLNVVQRARLDESLLADYDFSHSGKRIILVTGHRRENFGEGFESICRGLAELARRDDVEIVYPVHLNPNVQRPVREILSGYSNVHLIEPMGYLQFVALMDRATLVITDSGGVQEEAPSIGKPVLLLRESTEREEGVKSGMVRLVGADGKRIVTEAECLLDKSPTLSINRGAGSPYGDGHAAKRIVDRLLGIIDSVHGAQMDVM